MDKHKYEKFISNLVDDELKFESGLVARLDEASYQNGIIEQEAIVDAQAKQATKGESVWQAENKELLSKFKQGTEELKPSHSRTRTLQGFEPHLRRLLGTLKQINLRQNLINNFKYGPREDGPTGDKGITAISFKDQHHQDPDMVWTSLKIYTIIKSPKKIENLDLLESLSTLYLIQNKISQIEALDNLAKTLTSGNRITKLEGLDSLKKLQVSDTGANQTDNMTGIEGLNNLEELWANNNKMLIPRWNAIKNYLKGNPLQSEMGVNYRHKILIACPQLFKSMLRLLNLNRKSFFVVLLNPIKVKMNLPFERTFVQEYGIYQLD
ncbi:hypothetical protein MJO28_015441 [Puccinia striiformis f. sp. tritici]|uniref:Uncharacterized protein n=1 Tax=Puccinia striiformis f. sp. tritici TaxID=168172 RepID=A0ACC0DT83_9BASI|nr:hypothetical protein MJO28_015441 [Puccinia striiformis f. sp. tritici]